MNKPVLMTEDYWMTSGFSVARHYGGISYSQAGGSKDTYLLCNKEGITVFELSDPDSPYYVGDGVEKCIAPGEPVDLVNVGWLPIIREIGRDNVIKLGQDAWRRMPEIIRDMKPNYYNKIIREIVDSLPVGWRLDVIKKYILK